MTAANSATATQQRKPPVDDLKTTVPAGEPTIVMTRTFNAPRALVWEAWTKPEHLAKWWGPHEYEIVVEKLDCRPGGSWRILHKGKDGSVYAFVGIYKEIMKPEKIVNTFGVEGMFDGREIVETHTFEEVGGKTMYKSVSHFETLEDRDGMLASGMEQGARESMDRLDELLETLK